MTDTTSPKGDRIAKRLSAAGICSRREAERWIAQGRVAVNGTVLKEPGTLVGEADEIAIDGKPVGATKSPLRLFRLHKPTGVVTTERDERSRKTIYDLLPPVLPRVMTVGRLDLNSEGLLLLTTDGAVKRHLELPSTGWLRRYRVRVHGAVEEAKLAALKDGITVEGVRYGGIEARLDRQQGSNAWLTMGLREGKNREIRKVLEALGYRVNRLIRTGYGPFQLGQLPPGAVAEVPKKVLKEQLGGLAGTTLSLKGRKAG